MGFLCKISAWGFMGRPQMGLFSINRICGFLMTSEHRVFLDPNIPSAKLTLIIFNNVTLLKRYNYMVLHSYS